MNEYDADAPPWSPENEDPGEWEPTGDEMADAIRADGLLRRIAGARRELARIKAHEDHEVDRARRWAADMKAGPSRLIEWCERALEGYGRHRKATNPKVSTWKMPHGSVKYSEPAGTTEVHDEGVLLEWLVLNKQTQAIKFADPEVRRGEVRKLAASLKPLTPDEDTDPADGVEKLWLVTEDSEIIPGVHVERPAAGKVTVTPAD